jgi:DNA-binding NarL/FixJ family response regulator
MSEQDDYLRRFGAHWEKKDEAKSPWDWKRPETHPQAVGKGKRRGAALEMLRRQVVELAAEGLRNVAIAERVGVSEEYVGRIRREAAK